MLVYLHGILAQPPDLSSGCSTMPTIAFDLSCKLRPSPSTSDELYQTNSLCCAVVPSVSLAAELDLLLHLIALPPNLVLGPPSDMSMQPMFSSGSVAALYASQVLALSGEPILQQQLEAVLIHQHVNITAYAPCFCSSRVYASCSHLKVRV